MKLYHGSTELIKTPMLFETTKKTDFGNGFYTTSNFEQASKWALIKQKRTGYTSKAFVNAFNFDENIFKNKKYNIKIFENANEEWLDFVVLNRNTNKSHTYDLIKGPVANDNLFSTLTLFESGILSKAETILRLQTHNLFDQISFHSKNALLTLEFIKFID